MATVNDSVQVDFGDTRLPARFWKSVHITVDGCWIWCGYSRKGYGAYSHLGSMIPAHRYAYEVLVRTLVAAPKETCDHLCRNRSCVNPSHIEIVSNRENVLRGIGHTAVNARRTSCVNGHEFSESNTYRGVNSGNMPRRQCRECRRLSNARYRHRGSIPLHSITALNQP